ncbi:MAG: PD40 domain-containing protein [Pelomonas sp.]|nr:PD40 domain-containing protein [Roseateles sp.]
MNFTRTLVGLVPAFTLLGAHAAPLQVSSGGSFYNNFGPSLSADGSRLAYYGAGNPTGGNADNSFEVFVYERASGQTRQVSDQSGGQFAGGNQTPSLSGDGSRVAFQHFTINGGYAYFQTQSYDLNTNTLTTLTQPGFAETSAISRDGKTIAVATGNLGLRLYDTATQAFSAVLMTAPMTFTMSGDGKRIAYEGFSQGVRLYDTVSGTTTVVSPPGSGFNQRPVLSADGNSLVFTSSYDPLGQNADHSSEVFRYDIATQTLLQVTHGNGTTAADAGLSGDGTRIVFSSTQDITGHNADGNTEVFVYDLLAGSFLQLTDTLGAYSGSGVMSEDGSTVAWVSNANLDGANPYGAFQVFMDRLPPQVQARLPEPASLALVLVALGGLVALRRAPG